MIEIRLLVKGRRIMKICFEDLEPDNLSAGYKELMTLGSIDGAGIVEIHKKFGGSSLSLGVKLYDKNYVMRVVAERSERNLTVKDLAQRFGYSERNIRRMIEEINKRKEIEAESLV